MRHSNLSQKNRRNRSAGNLFVLVGICIAVSLLPVLASASGVSGEDRIFSGDKADAQERLFYEGTAIGWRNVISATTFNKDTEQTWNPYYAMEWSLQPRWWANPHFFVGIDIFISREITEADWTSDSGETLLGDIVTDLGWHHFYQIPVLGIDLSASLGLVAPTSKGSIARTLQFAARPRLTLTRDFDVLRRLRLGAQIETSFNSFGATTAQTESPAISCPASLQGCGGTALATQNIGVRNAPVSVITSLFVSVEITRWLALSSAFGFTASFLFDAVTPADLGYETDTSPVAEDVDQRQGTFFQFELAVEPVTALTAAIGIDTTSATLQSDGSRQAPIFNRNTNVYLDLRLDIARLARKIQTSRGSPP